MASRLRTRLRVLLRRNSAERELDEELRYYLDKLVDENLARGLSQREARAAALKSFGGFEQAKDECRDARGTRLVEDLLRDVGCGVRSLRRRPGFAALVVLCLAVGVGASITIFSLYNAVLLRPLPVRDPGQLVRFADGMFSGVSLDEKPDPGRLEAYSYELYQHLRDHAHVQQHFEGLAAQQSGAIPSVVRWTGASDDGVDDEAVGRCVSASYFEIVGVPAYRGRTFGPQDETTPGANPVIVLSHRFWRRRFGGDPALIGGQLAVNGTRYTVVGVTPPAFTGTRVGEQTDFWVPITMQAELMRGPPLLGGRHFQWLLLVGRSKPGVSLAAAEAAVNVSLQQFLAESPALDRQRRQAVRIGLESAERGLATANRHTRQLLAALMAGVGLLLLIVCLNVSHLLLARAIERQREMGIRAALGAGRMRLMRQLLAEGLLLSSLGVAAAAVVGRWGRAGLVALVEDGTPPAVDFSADARVLSFVLALALGTTIVLGLVPAWRIARGELHQVLRSTSQSVAGATRGLLGRVLLSSQVAFSLVLLVAASLLTASLGKLRGVDKGFDADGVLLVDINPRMMGLAREPLLLLYDEILRRVTALPQVRGASLSHTAVLGNCCSRDNITMPGKPSLRGVQHETVTPGYFEILGMTMVRGRSFTPADHQGAPFVAVINETLALRLFGATDVVGKRFRYEHFPPPSQGDLEVIGVVRDARTSNLRVPPAPIGYLPAAQKAAESLGTLQVSTDGDPAALAATVRQALREAHPGLPVVKVRTMRTQLEWSFTGERILAVLSGVFGLAALFVVCVGLYGVISRWAAQRTQEIGVRLALGATIAGVRWMVLRQALTHVLVGLALGLPAAVAGSRLLRGLLFGLEPTDPQAIIGAALVMFLVATAAAYLPARRASRVDPTLALRSE